MIPRIVSRRAYDEMLDKKNKTIADLLETLEEVESFGPKIPKEFRDIAKQAIEKAKEDR